MTREEWYSHLVDLGCIACAIERWGKREPGEMANLLMESPSTDCQIHHDRKGVGMSQKAHWSRTIGLCASHHEGGWDLPSVHFGSSNRTLSAFEARYGSVEDLNEYTQQIVAHKIKLEGLW